MPSLLVPYTSTRDLSLDFGLSLGFTLVVIVGTVFAISPVVFITSGRRRRRRIVSVGPVGLYVLLIKFQEQLVG